VSERKRARTRVADEGGGSSRRRRRGGGPKSQEGGRQQPQGGGKKGRKGNRKRSQNRRGKNRRPDVLHDADRFWGDCSQLPEASQDVRITDDPAAVPRSLGTPPLPGHEHIAEQYFGVVYDRAVGTAGLLAAAGGLIDPEDLVDED
jgi:hypothetical protein